MALEKLKRGCPYGKEIAEEIEKGGNAGIETRLAALETMFAAVLALKTQTTERLCRLIQTARLHSLLFNSPDVRA